MFYCLLSFESIFRGDFNWSCGMKYKYLCKTVSVLTHLFCYSLIWGYYIFYHYMKSVQIRSLFRSGFSCIRSEYRKIRTRKNSVFGHCPRSVPVPGSADESFNYVALQMNFAMSWLTKLHYLQIVITNSCGVKKL